MMTSLEVENIRRSAAMALSPTETARVLAELDRLMRERVEIVRLLDGLQRPWVDTRSTLNELSRLML